MARRITDDISIRLRTTSAWTNHLSRAKYFYIYHQRTNIFKDEFPYVRMPSREKEAYLAEVLRFLFPPKKKPAKKKPPKKKREIVPKKPPKVKARRRRAAIQRYEEKIIHSRAYGVDARTQHLEYRFKQPIIMNPDNYKQVREQLEFEFEKAMVKFYKMAKGKELRFLARIMIERRLLSRRGVIYTEKNGIGIAREINVKDLASFKRRIFDRLLNKLKAKSGKYFAGTTDTEFAIWGFSVENIIEFI